MELLNNFLTNFSSKLTNIFNNLKQTNRTSSDYYINILKNNDYQAIKYTNNIVLVLTQNINYWFEIKDDKNKFYVNFCTNGKYVLLFCCEYKLDVIAKELPVVLNLNNLNVSRCGGILHFFKNGKDNIDNKDEHTCILLTIKNTYVTELILYLNKDLIPIIINYLFVTPT